jgi:ABC-type multidrug transport system fused ATPase/permease subunit
VKPSAYAWPARSAPAWWACCISSTSRLSACTSAITIALLGTLKHLRDIGNTVIVVEHDEDAIRLADYVVDIGPGAGVHGGHIVAQGTPAEVMAHPDSLTGQIPVGPGEN